MSFQSAAETAVTAQCTARGWSRRRWLGRAWTGLSVLVMVSCGVSPEQMPDGLTEARCVLTRVLGDGGGLPMDPSLSGEGRLVAFHADSPGLPPRNLDRERDVFVVDRESSAVELISRAPDGSGSNGESWVSAISADGRFVAFSSTASNLVPDDGNETWDVFMMDRERGIIERISVSADGTDGNGGSGKSAISPDARFVVFESEASNLIAGDANGVADVFLVDRATGTIERVSSSPQQESNGKSVGGSVSADGRLVVFDSEASNLVAGDTNGVADVFMLDREFGTIVRVSTSTGGVEGDGQSWHGRISADGSHVIFASAATNLVPDDTNGEVDVFVMDLADSTVERVSVSASGSQGSGMSWGGAISADGGRVAFYSTASNLAAALPVADREATIANVYVVDRMTRSVARVGSSLLAGWLPESVALEPGGRVVAFEFTNWVDSTTTIHDICWADLDPQGAADGPASLAMSAGSRG